MLKKVVIMGDTHCGHRVGLTPPSYDSRPKKNYESDRYYNQVARWYPIRRALWNAYRGFHDEIGDADILIVNGDCVDGEGRKSGGSELISADMGVQCDMAVSCINIWNAPQIFITYGTAYHTGDTTDYEDDIASRCGASIRSHQFLEIEGVNFDIKHHPSSGASMPHTRKGPTVDRVHNIEWWLRDAQPKADVIIRNHLHWFGYTGNSEFLAVQMPALQGAGSKYGARRCSGIVDFGLCVFYVEDGEYDWKAYTKLVKEQKSTATVVK